MYNSGSGEEIRPGQMDANVTSSQELPSSNNLNFTYYNQSLQQAPQEQTGSAFYNHPPVQPYAPQNQRDSPYFNQPPQQPYGPQHTGDTAGGYEQDVTEVEPPKPMWKKVLKVVLSSVGLFLAVAAYCAIGTAMFIAIEKPAEDLRKAAKMEYSLEILQLQNLTIAEIYADSQTLNLYDSADGKAWRNASNVKLEELRHNISAAVLDEELKYDGTNERGRDDWEVANTILFVITIITTIGYGHITPKTDWGRLVVIPYGFLGIPLMIMFLGSVGDSMAQVTRYLYARMCCYLCNRKRLRGQYESLQNQHPHVEKPTSSTALETEEQIEKLKSKKGPMTRKERLRLQALERQHEAEKAREKLEEDNMLVLDESLSGDPMDQMSVPVMLTLVIIGSYVLLGAVLFDYWEAEWDMVIAAYYAFTTLSTIGFGDFVPGSTSGQADNYWETILSSVYIFLGLALLSMSFSLMQAEIIQKFEWLGKQIGIIEDDEVDQPGKTNENAEKETSLNTCDKSKEERDQSRIDSESKLSEPTQQSAVGGRQNRRSGASPNRPPSLPPPALQPNPDRLLTPAWGEPSNLGKRSPLSMGSQSKLIVDSTV